MKIAIVLGSPRARGNSSTIASRIAETAAGLGAETRTFELNSFTYRGCQACYACKTGHDSCVLQDDLTEVLDAVKEADLVVLASPVYYGEITGQLKCFMDRTFSYLVPDFHTNSKPSRLTPKKLIFVLTQGQPDEAMFADIFPRYEKFLGWQGFNDIRLIRACGIGPGIGDRVSAEILRQAEETARQLIS